jgi:hypothetical protein
MLLVPPSLLNTTLLVVSRAQLAITGIPKLYLERPVGEGSGSASLNATGLSALLLQKSSALLLAGH